MWLSSDGIALLNSTKRNEIRQRTTLISHSAVSGKLHIENYTRQHRTIQLIRLQLFNANTTQLQVQLTMSGLVRAENSSS